ncbi:hypothetical protein T265_02667 [Opisthorchis viverrini]|uniref:Uncharacterized protein n=1 Tax=Opisthorchis viverrini TaxID=6198 RepID=A0A074ZU33_OPIVI|nr:hypothetical protein T265_02667 [Opisthorchis viverrini]KER30988.1 hypothetical protein T265_02667 [Opisthorchis viverrini]
MIHQPNSLCELETRGQGEADSLRKWLEKNQTYRRLSAHAKYQQKRAPQTGSTPTSGRLMSATSQIGSEVTSLLTLLFTLSLATPRRKPL